MEGTLFYVKFVFLHLPLSCSLNYLHSCQLETKLGCLVRAYSGENDPNAGAH